MAKKQILKGSALSLRIPEKIRYGLEMASRRYRSQISTLVSRAIDDFLDAEGLTKRKDGELLSWLDKVWSESEAERLKALAEHAPMLMTPAEKSELEILKVIEACGPDLLLRLHDQVGLDEILAPGISDTFADDVLPGTHEFKNTLELKKAARSLYEELHPE